MNIIGMANTMNCEKSFWKNFLSLFVSAPFSIMEYFALITLFPPVRTVRFCFCRT